MGGISWSICFSRWKNEKFEYATIYLRRENGKRDERWEVLISLEDDFYNNKCKMEIL